MSEELCQCCKKESNDMRILRMSCGYEMIELGLPFAIETYELEDGTFNREYKLLVCKECRSDWMNYIYEWFNDENSFTECGSGIFVRDLGADREVTEEQFKRLKPGVVPVRLNKD